MVETPNTSNIQIKTEIKNPNYYKNDARKALLQYLNETGNLFETQHDVQLFIDFINKKVTQLQKKEERIQNNEETIIFENAKKFIELLDKKVNSVPPAYKIFAKIELYYQIYNSLRDWY